MFIFCLNLAIGLVIVLQFPGTVNVNPAGAGVNATEYEAHFNATVLGKGWQQTPFSGIPMIGDIFGGFNFLIQDIGYLMDGFPVLLLQLRDTYITDQAGIDAFDVIANALRAVYALLISIFLIEFISGRVFSDN